MDENFTPKQSELVIVLIGCLCYLENIMVFLFLHLFIYLFIFIKPYSK